MSLPQESYEKVNVRYCDCNSGWIHMDLSVGDKNIYLRLSETFDPIPDLINWMEAILTDVMECAFEIDEEGNKVKFISERRWNERLLLTIDSGDVRIFIRTVVHRRQMLSAFYSGLKNFADSEGYIPEQWARVTLEEKIKSIISQDFNSILDELVQMSSDKLKKFLFVVDPAYHLEWEGINDSSWKILKLYDLTMDPDNKDHEKGMVSLPSEWVIDEDYDSWSDEEKKDYIADYLKHPIDACYSGGDLKKIRSKEIEAYLSENQTDEDIK
ncbi:MAG: hypothetical protein GY729_13085 [Desulfobacteraceae bacterium]|nr:hypothetical protein [Desulfobacteraceae bacterium]